MIHGLKNELEWLAAVRRLGSTQYGLGISHIAVMSGVTLQVARALALKLLPAEQARPAGTKTVDPEV